jgi:hypothetical protein
MIQCGTCTDTQSFTQTIGVFEIHRCAGCGGLMEERRESRETNPDLVPRQDDASVRMARRER